MYDSSLSVGCVVLAAGNAVRFGGDKLSAMLGERSLLERALDAVPAEEFCAVAVVTRKKHTAQKDDTTQNGDKVAQKKDTAQNGDKVDAQNGEEEDVWKTAKRYGFTALSNPHPERGISGSVRIGLHAVTKSAASRPCDAVLFQTADQPLLRRETVRKLVRAWRKNPDKIAALAHNGVRGNPCVFPARFFPELLDLSGDRGGSVVMRRHPSDLILVETEEAELMDADTREDLERISEML